MRSVIIKALTFALLAGAGWAAVPAAAEVSPLRGLTVRVDWQEPGFLPRRFRNHCSFENFSGRPYCSDHCGIDYQFYYCSERSYGCCRLGLGYCDFSGALRCHP
jgi:hypothetical protein